MVNRIIKLYAWQPQGHGEQSFFVISETEKKAKKAVELEIKRLTEKGHLSSYDYDGWGTDYYKLTIADINKVLMNDNE